MAKLEVIQMSRGMEDVLDERTRQVFEEGWTQEHDDGHTDRSLAAAGATYAYLAAQTDEYAKHWSEMGWAGCSVVSKFLWPRGWNLDYLKVKVARRMLVIAAALLIAEIDRIDRLEDAHAQAGPVRGPAE
jgi:hypothetical protein